MDFPALQLPPLFMVSGQTITLSLNPPETTFFSWASSDPVSVPIEVSATTLSATITAAGESGHSQIKVGAAGYQTTLLDVYYDRELPKQLGLTIQPRNG